jgi:beta-glucosidase
MKIAGLLALLLALRLTAFAQYQYAFQNPDLPIEERVDNIVSLMTLDEKIACLGTNPSVPRLGIRGTGHVEGLHGLALGGPGGWGRQNPVTTTQFPQAIGMAETWDTDAIRLAASVEGYEVRYAAQNEKYKRGGLVVRAPNADLGRDPRWGRNEECYGEDAFFNGTLVAAFVQGLQGDNPKYWQAASLLKHLLANSNEDTRTHSSSDFDDRLLREYYSLPFRMGIVEGGARAYMAAYNAINRIPATAHPLLKEITVREWGQNGIICTDAGALRMMVTDHKYYPDLERAAAGAVRAGINQFLDRYQEPVTGAVKNGLLKESEIDDVIRGNFRVMIKLGLLDPPSAVPYAQIGQGNEGEPWQSEKHKAAVRLVTRKSIVLLKNRGRLLPLDRKALKSVAVIGPHVDEVLLDWYSGTPPYTVTVLDGIKATLGPGVMVRSALTNDQGTAADAARGADAAIVVIGNHPTCGAGWAKCPTPSDGKEAMDRKTIILEQEELARQVYQANPKTIVVLVASFPFAVNWTEDNIPAILHMTHNSQEMGNALADVLFGDYNPAGRLVQTWPASMDQLPPLLDYNIRDGRTYMYSKGKPLYPFGHGLSYTTFRYSNLRISPGHVPKEGEATISVDVRNTGTRAGEEVVQLYVRHLDSRVERPRQELRGFKRVAIAPGETRTVQIPLRGQTLAYWDQVSGRFVVEDGKVSILVGSSSADIRLERTVMVTR